MINDALPKGWVTTTLEQVASWGSGGTPKSKTANYYHGDIPWVVIGDLNDGLVSDTRTSITESGLANSAAKWVPKDSVLLAMYGSIGKLGISGRAVTTNQAVAFAIPDKKLIIKEYLFLYLLSQRDVLIRAGRGGTQQNISQTILKTWPIPLPPLAEQKRIVDALESYLSQIASAVQAVSRALKRARRLEESLSSITYGCGGGGDQGPAPEPSSAATDDGVLPGIPSSWSWKRLEEIAEVVGGITKDAKKQSDSDMVEVPYLRVANVQRGWLDLSQVSTIRVSEKKALQLKLNYGDVLLNEGGDRDKLGRGWIWEAQIPGAIHQNHVFRARVRNGAIHPKLLSFYANSLARWFESNGKQSVNLASISLSKIKRLPIPVPPFDEQDVILERIENHLSVISNASIAARGALAKANSLRRALLAQAFSGGLVPQDLNDEPASELLGRIRAEREAQNVKAKLRSPRRSLRKSTSEPRRAPATSTPIPTDAVQQELPL